MVLPIAAIPASVATLISKEFPSCSKAFINEIVACPPANVGGHHFFCSKYYLARQSAISCRGKYFDGRYDALSIRGSTLSAVMMLYPFAEVLCRPSEYSIQSRKYSVGRQDALSCRSRYSVGRHNAYSNCENTLSAVRMLYSSSLASIAENGCSYNTRITTIFSLINF